MRVIVTGATGFIGGAVARRYAADGAQVIGMGRNAARGRALFDDGVEFLQADLSTPGPWANAFIDADIVVHCAARASLSGTPEMFESANVGTTRHVVDACVQGRAARFVHMSSPSIYQTGTDRLEIRESDPLPDEFINPYADTKWRSELLVDAAMEDGLEPVTLRPRAVFGPGDSSIVPRIIRTMKTGRLRVIGDGENVVDVTFIDNLVDAVVLAGETDVVGGKYNLTNGRPIRIWDFIDRIADGLDLPHPRGRISYRTARRLAGLVEDVYRKIRPMAEPPVTRYGVDALGLSMTLDVSKARDELGYDPTVSIEQGLERLLEHYRTHGIPEAT